MTRSALLSLLFAGATGILWSQPRVDARNLHERILAVVPLTGTGTISDPVRPLFAPANAKEYQARSGVRQFSWQPTDDGKHAIVEFVAEDPAALARILRDPRVLKSFDKGKQKRSDIERELKKHRKDFDVEAFGRGKAR